MSVKNVRTYHKKNRAVRSGTPIRTTNSPFKNETKKGRKILIVVDMQKDFIDGSLGNEATKATDNSVIGKIMNHYTEYDAFYFTKDTHYENYLSTLEGKMLPVKHCIYGTEGIRFTDGIANAIAFLRDKKKYVKVIEKHTFGSVSLTDMLSCVCGNADEIELIGVCTDICVVSNALSLRQAMPNRIIRVDADCCAGTSEEAHKAALTVMKSCQIEIVTHKENENASS